MSLQKMYALWLIIVLIVMFVEVLTVSPGEVNLTAVYFRYKGVKQGCYMSCESLFNNNRFAKYLMLEEMRVSVTLINRHVDDLEKSVRQYRGPVGVVLDGTCDNTRRVLEKASKAKMFDAMHMWIVLTGMENNQAESMQYIDDKFQHLNLSMDADIVVTFRNASRYELMDVFSFGNIQGNSLEIKQAGTWSYDSGLNIWLNEFKYYDRWDFHNLTLRAVTVVLNNSKEYDPGALTDVRYTPGVPALTKMAALLLDVIKEQHNFRFDITVVGLWIGLPERNTTLTVTNSLLWGEQDISYTSCRIFPLWLQWMEPFLPPVTTLQTKFYYVIPSHGVGEYENRFLTPLSARAWLCACAAGAACALALAAAAAAERRPHPAIYAVFSVVAAACQQRVWGSIFTFCISAFEDGVQLLENAAYSSQGRRVTMLVAGLTSLLLYNYYTSSVVSWLLSAAAPTIQTLDGLINSDLELTFEDVGYTMGWLNNPGFYYYSGYKNPKEDVLRERKVTNAKRTAELVQTVEDGIELVRTGGYAFHSEPYTANQEISRRFGDAELCNLGTLPMMEPAHAYVMGPVRSPYKQFFVWSLMRVSERGHASAWRARAGGVQPACSGRAPRALALGQAAPALALLAYVAGLALLVLLAEVLWYRFQNRRRCLIQKVTVNT